jgi:hypothetical protein
MHDPKISVAGFMFDNNPDRTIEEILAEIKRNSIASLVGNNGIGSVLTPFSALLVHLSRDSERIATAVNKKTQALIYLTWVLIFMTVILILLTIPIVVIETHKFFSEISQVPQHSPQYKNHHCQNDQNPETTKKLDNSLPFGNVISSNIGVCPTITVPHKKKDDRAGLSKPP